MIGAGTLCIVLRSTNCGAPINGYLVTTLDDSKAIPPVQCNRGCCRFEGLTNRIDLIWHGESIVGRFPTAWLKPLPPLDEPVESKEREAVA